MCYKFISFRVLFYNSGIVQRWQWYMATKDKQRNYGLDIARSCAVALVFLSHSLLNLSQSKIPFLWYGVFIGVELFFSLSGFLIGRMLLDLFDQHYDSLSFKHISHFWIRRWFRTLPLYFILLAIYFIVYNRWIHPVSFDWRYFLFLQNLTAAPPGFYGETWSLSIEDWFYLGFPLLLFLVYLIKRRVSGSGGIEGIFVPLVLLVIVVQVIIRLFNPDCNDWGCIAVSFHFEAPAYGLMAAYVSRQMPEVKTRNAWCLLTAGLLLCGLAAIIKMKVDSNDWVQLYFPVNGCGTAMIVLGLYYCRFSRNYLVVPFVSRISYSIYLIHLSGIIIPLLKYTKGTDIENTWLLWFIGLVLTVGLSWLSYESFERPFLKIRDRWFKAVS